LIGDEEALWYGSQTGTVMALRFGLVGSSIEDRTIKGLLHDITKVKSGHHSTGIHGNRYIYTLLSDLGMQDLSSRLLSHPEFPSQAYIINAGMTTWPERQWEWTSGIEWNQSLNHPMQAGFAAFFYESLAGIRPDPDEPGFKQFIIKPSFLENLEFAGAEIESPYGTIVSKWKRLDKGIELDLEIPFNSKARVILPINRDQETSVFSAIYNAVEVPPNHGGGYWLGSGKYRLKFNSSVDG
jgi:alpha-L-rhamnosidase